MSQSLATRFLQARRGQLPQQAAKTILAKATTRDVHPVTGSAAIMQAAQSGAGVKITVSMNMTRADGTQGKAFHWGVPGFGWGDGEF